MMKRPMNPYQQLVAEYERFAREGREYPLGVFEPAPRPEIAVDAPKVLIFSPHPDDEVIIGGLALRLLREEKWRVINVAVTQGSRKERQAGRLEELKRCCECIGFDLAQTAPSGLEMVNPRTRKEDPAVWSQSVAVIARLLEEHQPKAILCPHELDWNSTHIGTHFLVLDALKTLAPGFGCYVVETEFWGQMATPNLMVELSGEHVGDLMTALTFHVGEVQRNPYHLTVPAWMIDNVRRGSELVGGQGGAAPDFVFATLYRLRRWGDGKLESLGGAGRQLSCADKPAGLFAS
jgi:N-acetylglucosamine malate deacetylase 1